MSQWRADVWAFTRRIYYLQLPLNLVSLGLFRQVKLMYKPTSAVFALEIAETIFGIPRALVFHFGVREHYRQVADVK